MYIYYICFLLFLQSIYPCSISGNSHQNHYREKANIKNHFSAHLSLFPSKEEASFLLLLPVTSFSALPHAALTPPKLALLRLDFRLRRDDEDDLRVFLPPGYVHSRFVLFVAYVDVYGRLTQEFGDLTTFEGSSNVQGSVTVLERKTDLG